MGTPLMTERQRDDAIRNAMYRYLTMEGDKGTKFRHACDQAYADLLAAVQYLDLRLDKSVMDRVVQKLYEAQFSDRMVFMPLHTASSKAA